MSDALSFTDELRQKFSQYNEIATLTAKLQDKLAQINDANRAAAGHEDATAKAYHKQVDKPTSELVDLIGNIASLFIATAATGHAISNTLNGGEENAQSLAHSWHNKG